MKPMRFFHRLLVSLAWFFAAFLLLVPPVFANENFETSLTTSYTISPIGLTSVKHTIDLKNRKPTVYAKQYGLKVSSSDLKNIVVRSNGVVISPEIVETDNQTSIGITFPDTLLGEGKTRKLEVSYQDANAAVVSGKVLEVLVPKIANPDEYDSYNLTINTPASYGRPTRVTPTDFTTQELDNRITTSFALQNGEGVVALFGTQQIFKLELQYHLENPSSNTGLAQIALPPDTTFQKIWYEQLDPQPQSIQSDEDGNWIATYQVPPQQTIEVVAIARVLTALDPMEVPGQARPSNQLTSDLEFWQTSNAKIIELSKTYQTPRAIYDYVVDALSYNYQALEEDVPRLGAVEALEKPDLATCQEFTDVFVAMARAAEIPTRRVTGYAYTQNSLLRPLETNSDILHTWPEYFDEDLHQWHPVDPTWGNTTGGVNYFDQFDLNHIAFAINGLSSTLPYPAGSYKSSQTQSKDVMVTFDNDFPSQPPQLTIELVPALTMGVPLPGTYQLRVTNQQGRAWYNTSVTASSNQGLSSLPQTINLPQLLPFETVEIPLQLFSNRLWQGGASDLQLDVTYVDNQNENETAILQLSPLTVYEGGQISRLLSYPVTIPGLVLGCIILALFAGSLLVRRRK